ncbi:hypothetical protein IMG5_053510 [Ichthyophthirius multifiliis]|uniref:Uncharacterized protein n=1 Tax=Ichthyophthirius multifiliis TaxID=5932 RepID=G0QMY1_ICHMU|nr:hypothetical protein IMG5_053510 [Ichthyophthirius multifiliis]EGR33426.1 hypothetical protein IMG5_053510 [Ichthyophthirius multifiliis]|eukprot:XP_004037412.1 hypothetical protein IMG5_053510 [Ichthyophthirius multifiliis]
MYTPSKPYIYPSTSYPRTTASTLAYSSYIPNTYLGVRKQITSTAPRPHEWTEYQPVEKKYIDYIPETKIEYRPIERTYQDFVEIKHVTDYEPVKRVEKRIEYVPVDHYDEYIDYYPKQYSYYTRSPQDVDLRASQVQSQILNPVYSSRYNGQVSGNPYRSTYYRSPYSYYQ